MMKGLKIQEFIDSSVHQNVIPKGFLKCQVCSYQCKKKHTLEKHTNTKQGEATNKSDLENQLYCDECSSPFTSKKGLKAHKKLGHELLK